MNYKDAEILLVEDNPHDVELTLRSLQKHNLANRVQVVKDGAEALDFIFNTTGSFAGQANHLKVILLDLKLPKVSGLEVLQRLKDDERTRTIPVVVLTFVPRRPGYRGVLSAGGEQLRGQAGGIRVLRQDRGGDGLLLAAGE